jgi:hypothetical protein
MMEHEIDIKTINGKPFKGSITQSKATYHRKGLKVKFTKCELGASNVSYLDVC